MPNRRSAIKKLRADKKRHTRNLMILSDLKTQLKKVRALITSKKEKEAREAINLLTSKLDKAVSKGILHRKNADRRKSRLSVRLRQVLSA